MSHYSRARSGPDLFERIGTEITGVDSIDSRSMYRNRRIGLLTGLGVVCVITAWGAVAIHYLPTSHQPAGNKQDSPVPQTIKADQAGTVWNLAAQDCPDLPTQGVSDELSKQISPENPDNATIRAGTIIVLSEGCLIEPPIGQVVAG